MLGDDNFDYKSWERPQGLPTWASLATGLRTCVTVERPSGAMSMPPSALLYGLGLGKWLYSAFSTRPWLFDRLPALSDVRQRWRETGARAQ
jgi:hypothetical protein